MNFFRRRLWNTIYVERGQAQALLYTDLHMNVGFGISFCPTGNTPGPVEPASEEVGKGGMSAGPDIPNRHAIVLQRAVTAERGLVPPEMVPPAF